MFSLYALMDVAISLAASTYGSGNISEQTTDFHVSPRDSELLSKRKRGRKRGRERERERKKPAQQHSLSLCLYGVYTLEFQAAHEYPKIRRSGEN